jgi:putative lipoic acid-binding regulatory protein
VSVVTACETFTAMTDTDVKSHKIEFPCDDYPIKVIGDTGVGFTDAVIEILSKHATINIATLAERQSSNGKYTTVQLHIVATGEDQLRDINSALRATGVVHMVL